MITLLIIFTLIRSLVLRKKSLPVRLFLEALKKENSGQFETAISGYEGALLEVRKTRNHSYLEARIIEKLKILHTVIAYQKGFKFRVAS